MQAVVGILSALATTFIVGFVAGAAGFVAVRWLQHLEARWRVRMLVGASAPEIVQPNRSCLKTISDR